MDLRIEKRVGVRAPSARIWELISDLPGWGRWNPIETQVEGAIAYGGVISLVESIPGLPERRLTARIGDWQPYSQLIWAEKRGWQFGAVRYYEIEELEPGSCIVSNGVIFSGLRGEGFHDKHRRTIRSAFEHIGESLRLEAQR